MAVKITLAEAIDNYADLVASMTYLNYKHNRNISPHITPEQWKLVYEEKVQEMEILYQYEKERS